ncbi:MAG: hypothetical protein IBX64_13475, partial [Actinobacteria bacterium]|nr:hypothetical protein [Actinomycetota bacterium]
IQKIFDELINRGVDATTINVLHNRMPRSWRSVVEEQVHRRFGKGSSDGDWILLTNQVAEAGLGISAPLVISDPAPVDALVQRAGRCARWFHDGKTTGTFIVINAPKDAIENRKAGLALPYRADLVQAALKSIPKSELTWQAERTWVNNSWSGDPKKAKEAVKRAFNETVCALNLFDRAAQERKPGEIARTFREILTVDVAVENTDTGRDLQSLLNAGEQPETSSVSLGKAYGLLREARGEARIIRNEDGELILFEHADYVRPGDVLVVPSNIAYLHRLKGLCFGNGLETAIENDVFLSSEWKSDVTFSKSLSREDGKRQGLLEHVMGVMEGTYQRLSVNGIYRNTLVKILKSLEPEKDPHKLADVITQIATLAAGFHDLGKVDYKWQAKARQVDSECPDGLIGRTLKTQAPMGIPHTYPGYLATIVACQVLTNYPDSSKHLVRAIALAGVRHHSSLMNPALTVNRFEPHREANDFVSNILREISAPGEVIDRVNVILDAAKGTVPQEMVPLLLPNDDLFPIYALVGRAILMADRENAAGKDLEQWKVS